MSISQNIRDAVYAKCAGRCAYCGSELNGKFQVDHVISQRNFEHRIKNQFRVPEFLKHLTLVDVNHIDNLLPACASCNNYKSTHDLEGFRKELGLLIERLNKTSSIYRIAKRFGSIKEMDQPIRFYFEDLSVSRLNIEAA